MQFYVLVLKQRRAFWPACHSDDIFSEFFFLTYLMLNSSNILLGAHCGQRIAICSVVSNFAAPQTVASPGFSVHGIFQARLLEWVAISNSRRPSQARDGTCVSCSSCLDRWVLYHQGHQGSPKGNHGGYTRGQNIIFPLEEFIT